MSLNSQQRAAVHHLDGPLLVLAGAGSGKTRVITHKIAHLIQHCGISPRHIAAVTFTNKAATEMKNRVSRMLGSGAKGLQVCTFHTLGLSIVRQELKGLGHRKGFSIFDSEDSANLLSELLCNHYGNNSAIKDIQRRISRWKYELFSPEDIELIAKDEPALKGPIEIYKLYQHHLHISNALDFDDLIFKPVQLLKNNSVIRDLWHNRIRYLLVDEYQDTNICQYHLIRMLSGMRGALTVVGDDDQSVYGWRGAEPHNIVLLQKDYLNLKIIKLEQNYRSSRRILKVANHLIANNSHIFPKTLWSDLDHGDPIRIIEAHHDEHEARSIISEILAHKFKQRSHYRDYAILYRNNYQSRLLEKALREQHIPYNLSGGTSFFSLTEVKDILSYLRLLVNPDDDSAFLRVVNTPRRDIGSSTIEKLSGYANQRGISLFAACFEFGLKQQLNPRAVTHLMHFANWLTELNASDQHNDPVAVIHKLISSCHYEQWIRDQAKDNKSAERKIANVWELVGWMQYTYKNFTEDKTLENLVAHMSLLDILERRDEENDADRVHLLTLHAAKGLEFPYVFLIGMEEELIPHRISIDNGNIEEERRLAYVGITRAQKMLTISYCGQRKQGGDWQLREPSRFLAELPPDDLIWERIGNRDPIRRQEHGQAHFANLRSLLGSKEN